MFSQISAYVVITGAVQDSIGSRAKEVPSENPSPQPGVVHNILIEPDTELSTP